MFNFLNEGIRKRINNKNFLNLVALKPVKFWVNRRMKRLSWNVVLYSHKDTKIVCDLKTN